MKHDHAYNACSQGLWAERTLGRALAGERAPASPFTLRLFALVACKFTVVGGRGFTGPHSIQLFKHLVLELKGSAIFNGREPKSCLGRVFIFKFDS